jgi:hypothetical protein
MKCFLSILSILISFQLDAQTALEKLSTQEITFDRHQIDPNEMTQNASFPETYNYTFHFKNTGTEPVLFTRCQCPCGCYIVNDVPKEVFKPGEEGEFKVSYWYQKGIINKSVYLHTNIPDPDDPGGYKRYEFKVVGEFKN